MELPDDFRCVIQEHDGGNPIPNVIDFGGWKEKVFTGLIPLLEPNLHTEPIVRIFDNPDTIFPQGIIPFGDDPFGNKYCLDYRAGSSPTIVYWDHEEEMDSDAQFTHVAESFAEFLDRLYVPVDD